MASDITSIFSEWLSSPIYSVKFDDCLVTNEIYYEILNSRQAINDSDVEDYPNINEIRMDNQVLVRDGNAYYYSVGSKNPIITLVSESKVIKSSVSIAINSEHITTDNIANNVPISFAVYSDKYYQQFNLICTTLPIMNISCEQEIPVEADTGEAEVVISLWDNNTNSFVSSTGLIHVRGNSTRYFPQKSYKVNLCAIDDKGHVKSIEEDFLELGKDDEWILYSPFSDHEKIRNVFSSNLWKKTCATNNALNVDFGNEYKFLEVFINNQYAGLYALTYPVSASRMKLSGNEKYDGLYKIIDYTNARHLTRDLDGNIGGFDLKGNSSYDLIDEYFVYLENNKSVTAQLLKGIDIDNAIDFFLFTNLVQANDTAWENCLNNAFLLLNRNDNNLQGVFCPWDLDMTWGNEWFEDETWYTGSYTLPAYANIPFEFGYFGQIMLNDDSDIWDMIYDRYQTLRKGPWSVESIDNEIDYYENVIFNSGAYMRERERWPEGNYLEFNTRLDTFREFVHSRFEFCDQYMDILVGNIHQSPLIRRSLQYPHFLESDFNIVLFDHSALEDYAIIDLFKYIGIDFTKISSDCTYIIGNPQMGYEYMNNPIKEESYQKVDIKFVYDNYEYNMYTTYGYELKDY